MKNAILSGGQKLYSTGCLEGQMCSNLQKHSRIYRFDAECLLMSPVDHDRTRCPRHVRFSPDNGLNLDRRPEPIANAIEQGLSPRVML